MSRFHLRHPLALTLAFSLACSSGTATTPPAPAAPVLPAGPTTLLTRLGADTLVLEQYTRTATHMDGIIIARSPFTTISRYSVETAQNGAATQATFSVTRGDGSAIAGALPLVVRYGADSVYFTNKRASGDTTRATVVKGEVLPYANNSYGLYELAIARMKTLGRDSADFTVVPLNFGARTFNVFPVRTFPGDSARITWFSLPLVAHYDRKGGFQVVDASRTTVKVRADRVAGVDMAAMAKAWAAAEKTAGALGLASTRDTVRATIGGAHLWIDYGRPALRGRTVWVNGVLGDTLWRAGANAATQFRTDVDVNVGGTHVPPGTYTLWVAATPSGYRLAINKQAGQWGTEYHAERDLARVAMRESAVAAPAEHFTITVSGGALHMTWGTKQLSVPVTAR
ncbi:MAG: hypothetical protein JWM95_3314 [Gemmatimonadetes bacterium]|nr:hypothetical protein [Gemmatimonadota bacterium]